MPFGLIQTWLSDRPYINVHDGMWLILIGGNTNIVSTTIYFKLLLRHWRRYNYHKKQLIHRVLSGKYQLGYKIKRF